MGDSVALGVHHRVHVGRVVHHDAAAQLPRRLARLALLSIQVLHHGGPEIHGLRERLCFRPEPAQLC